MYPLVEYLTFYWSSLLKQTILFKNYLNVHFMFSIVVLYSSPNEILYDDRYRAIQLLPALAMIFGSLVHFYLSVNYSRAVGKTHCTVNAACLSDR